MSRLCTLALLAACAGAPVAGPDPLRPGGEPLELELVRWAGRMVVRAWLDDEQNVILHRKLDRESYALPIEYDKARTEYAAVRKAGGSHEAALAAVDEAYGYAVRTEFEKFWKTGPFATPAAADRRFVLDDRLRTPGLHHLHITVEPSTVSWSATFRLVRGGRTLYSVDLDSEQRGSWSPAPVAVSPIPIEVP